MTTLRVSCYIFQISRRDDTKLWVEYSEVQKSAEALRIEEGGEVVDITPRVMEGEGEDTKPTIPANKWVIKTAENMITQHMAKRTLEELIFGPGLYQYVTLVG